MAYFICCLRWYVDSIPIRVFRNYENEGIAYPNKQGMRVYTSLWNADDWATRGGLDKANWSGAPFVARMNHFRPRACPWNGAVSISQCASNVPANWWTSPTYKQLSYAKLGQMNWVRSNYMIYDYCKDTKRFNGQMPPECFKAQFWLNMKMRSSWKVFFILLFVYWFCPICLCFNLCDFILIRQKNE